MSRVNVTPRLRPNRPVGASAGIAGRPGHGSDNIPAGIRCRPCAAPPSMTAGSWAPRRTPSPSSIAGSGSEPDPVTLPHDAMIGAERSPSGHGATAYFPSGTWEYRKSFDVSSDDAGTAVFLEFDGVYRDAGRAGQRHAGGPPAWWLLGFRRPDRPPAALRRDQRSHGRCACPRRQPVVLGGRYLPQCLVASGRTAPPGVRWPAGRHARDRRRRGGGGGQRGRAEPVDHSVQRSAPAGGAPLGRYVRRRGRSARDDGTGGRPHGPTTPLRRRGRTDGVPTIRISTPAGRS